MRSYLVLTEAGPILALTSRPSITDGGSLEALRRRGISKFIAYEVPVDDVHQRYGVPFEVIAAEVEGGTPVRVLDFNGREIFSKFSFSRLGEAVAYEH